MTSKQYLLQRQGQCLKPGDGRAEQEPQHNTMGPDFDDQIIHLTRAAQEEFLDRQQELEQVELDLEGAIGDLRKKRGYGSHTCVVCHSKPGLGGRSPVGNTKRMGARSKTGGGKWRHPHHSHDVGHRHEEKGVPDSEVFANSNVVDTKKVSATQRRLALVKDQFSAKNLFNVRRSYSTLYSLDSRSKRPDGSQDGLRKAMSALTLSKPGCLVLCEDRTVFSPHEFQPGRRGYLRPTTSSASKLTARGGRFCPSEDAFSVGSRHPRSRRELQRLSRMKADPFVEDVGAESPESWEACTEGQHDLLDRLRNHQPLLQARVVSFLTDTDRFNKCWRYRSHVGGLSV